MGNTDKIEQIIAIERKIMLIESRMYNMNVCGLTPTEIENYLSEDKKQIFSLKEEINLLKQK